MSSCPKDVLAAVSTVTDKLREHDGVVKKDESSFELVKQAEGLISLIARHLLVADNKKSVLKSDVKIAITAIMQEQLQIGR